MPLFLIKTYKKTNFIYNMQDCIFFVATPKLNFEPTTITKNLIMIQ